VTGADLPKLLTPIPGPRSRAWVDRLALPAALITRSGTLRVHAGSELHHDGAHTAAFASLASLDGFWVGAADSIALGAEAHALNFNLSLLSIV
jgi:hypothetical protein